MNPAQARLVALLTERPEYQKEYARGGDFQVFVQMMAGMLPLLLKSAYDLSQQDQLNPSAHTERLMGGSSAGRPFAAAR